MTVHSTPVELVGGAVDGEIVYPRISSAPGLPYSPRKCPSSALRLLVFSNGLSPLARRPAAFRRDAEPAALPLPGSSSKTLRAGGSIDPALAS